MCICITIQSLARVARTSHAGRQSPSTARRTSPRGNTAAGPQEGPPLLATPPERLLPCRLPLRSRCRCVSQPCPRPTSGRGRTVSPVTRMVRTGECWALNDDTALNRPLPVQQPTSTTLRDRVRDGRPAHPTAVEGHSRDVLKPSTRTGRQGRDPPGTSLARPPPGAK